MNAIVDARCLYHLRYLLEFLAAWEKRPAYLTPMAYQWCSAISEAAGRFDPGKMSTGDRLFSQQNLTVSQYLPHLVERRFSEVGVRCDPIRLDATSHRTHGHSQHPGPKSYSYLLSVALDIGFRHVTPSHYQSALHLDHTSHHKWM